MNDEILFTFACGHRGAMKMTDKPDEDSRVCDFLSEHPCPKCAVGVQWTVRASAEVSPPDGNS